MALIAVIGTGLIGTSMALALKQAQIKNLELVGADRDNSALAGAKKRNAFDRLEPRLTAAVHDADMVILLEATANHGRVACSGAIEEPAVRDAIVRTVDGGEEAFRLRRRKYGF